MKMRLKAYEAPEGTKGKHIFGGKYVLNISNVEEKRFDYKNFLSLKRRPDTALAAAY
jgi:hypothetical protein